MDETSSAKILLVEDEHLLRGLIAQFLRAEGFTVIEAADGQEGVDQFARQAPFDVILLDLNLPYLPGVEVCRRIKQAEPHQPVIICSASILDNHVQALQMLGVHDYLSKPYHPAELLRRIAHQIQAGQAVQGGQCPPARAGSTWRHDAARRSSHHQPYPVQETAHRLK